MNGLRNGYGEYMTKDSNMFKGNWLNDKFMGEGQIEFKDKSIYKGIFFNGKKAG